MKFALTPGASLVAQIEHQVRDRIESGRLKAGARLPSVRGLARELGVSVFTVVTAYDRLAAANYVRSRPGAGYFVVEQQLEPPAEPAAAFADSEFGFHRLFGRPEVDETALKAGSGVLPPGWCDDDALRRQARAAIRQAPLFGYPSPRGYAPLRDLLALRLIDLGVSVQADQIVTANGASHAVDLAVRALLPPGAAVAVEDPGYYLLHAYLKRTGVPFVAAPRGPEGLDIDRLEAVLRDGRVKMLIVNTLLHNPTGSSLSPVNVHRLLSLAERWDLLIVEDDIYGDFHTGPQFRIANLDQLNRVVHVSSVSKTISADLRCGWLAARRDLAARLLDFKTVTQPVTSELSERIVAELMASGEHRRQVERLRQRLALKRARAIAVLQDLGFEIFTEPAGGFFLWARPADGLDAEILAQAGAREGVVLAPGHLFSPDGAPSSWSRFNAVWVDHPEFTPRMRAALDRARRTR